ncbi:MAG TPA: sensor domain-containing diguanylate cyclase [Holophagaceae bacterium]|nr:sensor domain-containing diguanylate cyclase [Holophagaceae bacterium]
MPSRSEDPKPAPLEPLSAARLLQIIHLQTEIAKSRLDLPHVIARTADMAQLITGADGAAVEMAEGTEMVYRAGTGLAAGQIGLRLSRGTSLSGLCVTSGEALVSEDTDLDPRVDRKSCQAVGLRSMVVVPLKHEGRSVGVLKVMSARPGAFNDADIRTLELISEVIAAAMAHADELGNQVEESRTLYLRATQDALTGLGNRALFHDRLRLMMDMARRDKECLGLVMVDMDGLKPLNDAHGHRVGDEAIRVMGQRLHAATRKTDLCARLGGDEFAVLLPGLQDREIAAWTAGKIADQLQGPFSFEGREHPLGASMGLALFPLDGEDEETLIAYADEAMYADKRARSAKG